jgi:hypothetical protein
MTTFPKPPTDRQRARRREHAFHKQQRERIQRDWVSMGEAGEAVMKLVERNWPTCEAVVVRVHPDWRCVCGRALKTWDVVLADPDDSVAAPCRILCSACHVELLALERAEQ